MEVEFTQFMRPDGREVSATCEVADTLSPNIEAIKAAGAGLEMEVLLSGEVSLAISDPEDGDFDGEVIPNGPDVPDAVDRLIRRFTAKDFRFWREQCAISDKAVRPNHEFVADT